jgi:hypothetical protein
VSREWIFECQSRYFIGGNRVRWGYLVVCDTDRDRGRERERSEVEAFYGDSRGMDVPTPTRRDSSVDWCTDCASGHEVRSPRFAAFVDLSLTSPPYGNGSNFVFVWARGGHEFCLGHSRAIREHRDQDDSGGRARHRSADLTLFRRALYQLSYPTG